MNKAPTIVWFYQDLRLFDNNALSWAAARGPILPLYIRDDSIDGSLTEGGASKVWLHEALRIFANDLAQHNIHLILKHGKPLDVLRELIVKTGAEGVTWARRYEPHLAKRDQAVAKVLEQSGITVSIQPGFLLFEPEQVRSQSGTMFKIFTPFSRACFSAPPPTQPLPLPQKLCGSHYVNEHDLHSLHFRPTTGTWPDQLARPWPVGEQAARAHLDNFIDDHLIAYKSARDRPDTSGTSRLSPYLHFGHISPRQIWHSLKQIDVNLPEAGPSAERYRLELLWREFSWHLLHHIPNLPRQPLQKAFSHFPWRADDGELQAWQRGMTGYPIIDAGMRELWQTGWMHNRVRMITASFLVKDLLIDWRRGMEWFWDTLVDADLGNNTASWQWVAGCGADAAPYFRIFNPTLQGQKFDPNGDYVRRYVPELTKLGSKYIHEPWKAPSDILAKASITLGKSYPLPIVDHRKARQRALHALAASKGQTGSHDAPDMLSQDLFD
jgi:deoxyribodipyrimidine photo-lyase